MDLKRDPKVWLVTGAAGFIGSHLVETLLTWGQRVVGMDNFATGYRRNLDEVRVLVGQRAWRRFRFLEADIRELPACRRAVRGIDYVLHLAALASVPRSLRQPLESHAANVTGTLHILEAARQAGVRRVVYASSSAVYGDHPGLPKVEDRVGQPLSPYAATKGMAEDYARVYGTCYGLETIGLRYFNVFGARQDPKGAYAAVIPCWIAAMLQARPVVINGDGLTSRDFCHVANVVQANLLAATARRGAAVGQVYNVALGGRTTLNELFEALRSSLEPHCPHLQGFRPVHGEFRSGDVRHSQADIGKARALLGYRPTHDLAQGLAESLEWYRSRLG
jgi:UDP-N-acetylglucosamine 4-epimerase